MWEKCDLYLSSKYFLFPFFVRQRSVFFARSEGLHPLSYGSRCIKSPSTNTDIQPPPLCLLTAPQGFTDSSCLLLHHLKRELWHWNQSVWQDIQPRCLQTCLWRMAKTSRHWKLSPLPAKFAQLVLCGKISVGSWRGGTADVDWTC